MQVQLREVRPKRKVGLLLCRRRLLDLLWSMREGLMRRWVRPQQLQLVGAVHLRLRLRQQRGRLLALWWCREGVHLVKLLKLRVLLRRVKERLVSMLLRLARRREGRLGV